MKSIDGTLAAALLATMAVLDGCGGSGAATTGTTTGSGGHGTGGAAGGCAVASAQGIAVTASDFYGGTPYALGYPPYAIDGCRLVYVKPAASGQAMGDLVIRDLEGGTETVLASGSEAPRRPVLSGDLVAWEATVSGKSAIRVQGPSGPVTVTGTFDHAGEPRVAPDAVIFTGWLGPMDLGDTDVFLYTPSTGTLTLVATGAGQQRFADVSPTHVAWSDFSEGPSGAFTADGSDAADIVLLDRATQVVSPRVKPGKQAFPMLGAQGKLGYLDWGLVHPEPKFSEYDLRIGDLAGPVTADALVEHIQAEVPYIRPIARGAYLEWVAVPGVPVLRRQAVDLSTPVETVSMFPGVTVYGPSASEAITLVAATGGTAGAPVTLHAFAR